MKKVLIAVLCALMALSITACGNANKSVTGEFYDSIVATDQNGNKSTYYHFKSYDDKVWWYITEEQLGFIPKANTEYMLVYDENGTTSENKPCDCAPESECECEVYDDIFVEVKTQP